MNNCRNNLKRNFSTIPNALIQDDAISDRARFLFCYMASKPDDWQFYQRPLAKGLGYSLETLRKYMDELIRFGWLTREAKRAEKGRFDTYDYTLQDSPLPNFTVSGKTGHGKNPTRENLVLTKERPKQKKDLKQKKTKTNFSENKFSRPDSEFENFEIVGAEIYPLNTPNSPTPPELRATPPKASKYPIYEMFETYARFMEAKGFPQSKNNTGNSYKMLPSAASALKHWAEWAEGMPGAGNPIDDWAQFLDAAWQSGDKWLKGRFTVMMLNSQKESIVINANKAKLNGLDLEAIINVDPDEDPMAKYFR